MAELNPHTIHPNDCGNCKHFKQWEWEREFNSWKNNPFTFHPHKKDDLHFGDCDKIPIGTKYHFEVGGKEYEEKYDGYSFEDECYDEYFQCFEEA